MDSKYYDSISEVMPKNEWLWEENDHWRPYDLLLLEIFGRMLLEYIVYYTFVL